MNNKYAGFVPFIDEAAWFANAIEQVTEGNGLSTSRPTVSDGIDYHDCCSCWGVFLETELCEITGFCAECNARLDAAIMIVDLEGE